MHYMKYLIAITLLALSCPSARAQAFSPQYLAELNKSLPHKFKSISMGATLEAVRMQESVKLYLLIDDIEQYEQVLIERSDEFGSNFAQCKQLTIEKGKYRNNYLELLDQYPVSTKMATSYRIKTITSDGIIRMYPAVAVVKEDADNVVQR